MTLTTGQVERNRIVKLDPATVNRIAAGEVIERPATVIKELGENSLDAGARRLVVEIEQGGKRLIRVRDDGGGIPAEELPLALHSHATSKLGQASDLVHIGSFGFRGEALASMASIGVLTLRSRPAGQAHGAELISRFGELAAVKPCGMPPGTEVTLTELFATTPARLKFLKGSSTELSHVVEAIWRLALPHPEVAFVLRHDERRVFELAPQQTVRERIVQFWGPACGEALRELDYCEPGLAIRGQIALPSYTRPNATRIALFVNGRHIRDRSLIAAVREAYREYLPSGRYPAALIELELPLEAYDVNVHPQKLELRFREPRRLFARLKTAIRERLMQAGGAPPRLALAEFYRERPATPANEAPPAGAPTTPTTTEPAAPPAPPPSPRTGDLLARILAHEPPVAHAAEPPRRETQVQSYRAAFATPPSSPHDADRAEEPGDWPRRAADLSPPPPPDDAAAPATAVAATARPAPPGSLTAGLLQLYQLGQRYLLLEYAQRLAIVDQHALHERVLFAQFTARFREPPLERQRLLLPLPLDLTVAEAAALTEPACAEALQQLGFTVHHQPDAAATAAAAVTLHAVPALLARRLSTGGIKATLEATLAELRQRDPGGSDPDDAAEPPPTLPQIARRVIATLACKAAIKAGEALSEPAAYALLEEADRLDDATTCPHGRPTTIELPYARLDALFGR